MKLIGTNTRISIATLFDESKHVCEQTFRKQQIDVIIPEDEHITQSMEHYIKGNNIIVMNGALTGSRAMTK
jgi:hypothetical protein